MLRYDAESFPTLGLLVRRLVMDAARALQVGLEKTAVRVKDYFWRLRPEFSVNATQIEWSVKIGTDLLTRNMEHVPLLLDALDRLERMAKEEVREARQPKGRFAPPSGIDYVFASSDTCLLTAMVINHSRLLYRFGMDLFIGPMLCDAFNRFLSGRFAQGRFSITGRKSPIR